jgi:rubredoxin
MEYSMEIDWICPNCKAAYKAYEILAGEEYWCEACGYVVPLLGLSGREKEKKPCKMRKRERKEFCH